MKHYKYITLFVVTFLMGVSAMAQVDKKDVRRGNRDFKKENYREAEIDYRKALVKDSLSVAANYNLANTLYREGDYAQAQQVLERVKDTAPMSSSPADYYFNLGDVALQKQDYQKAVDAFAESLILRPDDLQAKENYIYARKKLDDQQNQNNDQNQNQDQNQDQDNDQNNDQQDQNKNQDQDQNNDQNQDQKDNQQPPQQSQGQQPKITPQAAQQMLQAIQAKEKETQDKVNKQKAEALKSRQKEKNW